MCKLYTAKEVRFSVDDICIGIFYSIRNRAAFQFIVLKVLFFVSSPVIVIRLFGFKLRIANAAKKRPGSSTKMPKTRKNSILYPPVSNFSIFLR